MQKNPASKMDALSFIVNTSIKGSTYTSGFCSWLEGGGGAVVGGGMV